MLFYELFNSWDNFWLRYLNNLSVISEQPELIPDPLWVSELQQAYDLQWIWDLLPSIP